MNNHYIEQMKQAMHMMEQEDRAVCRKIVELHERGIKVEMIHDELLVDFADDVPMSERNAIVQELTQLIIATRPLIFRPIDPSGIRISRNVRPADAAICIMALAEPRRYEEMDAQGWWAGKLGFDSEHNPYPLETSMSDEWEAWADGHSDADNICDSFVIKPRFPLIWKTETFIAPMGSYHLRMSSKLPGGRWIEKMTTVERAAVEGRGMDEAVRFWQYALQHNAVSSLVEHRYALTKFSDERQAAYKANRKT